MDKNNIDKLFKDKLYNREVEFNARAWEAAEKLIEQSQRKRAWYSGKLLWSFAALIIGLGGFYFLQDQKSNSGLAENKAGAPGEITAKIVVPAESDRNAARNDAPVNVEQNTSSVELQENPAEDKQNALNTSVNQAMIAGEMKNTATDKTQRDAPAKNRNSEPETVVANVSSSVSTDNRVNEGLVKKTVFTENNPLENESSADNSGDNTEEQGQPAYRSGRPTTNEAAPVVNPEKLLVQEPGIILNNQPDETLADGAGTEKEVKNDINGPKVSQQPTVDNLSSDKTEPPATGGNNVQPDIAGPIENNPDAMDLLAANPLDNQANLVVPSENSMDMAKDRLNWLRKIDITIVAGGGLASGFRNPSDDIPVGSGFSPVIGFKTGFQMNSDVAFDFNVLYNQRGALSKEPLPVVSGAENNSVVTKNLHYLQIPFYFNYNIGRHNIILGMQYAYLLATKSEITDNTSLQATPTWNKQSYFATSDLAGVAGYQYMLTEKLNIGARLNYGIFDVTDKQDQSIETFDRNIHFNILLEYKLLKY